MRSKTDNYGAVIDPNWVDWSRYQYANYTQEAMNLAIRKRVACSRMRRFRSVPVIRRVWWVTLTATIAPLDGYSARELPAGLTSEPQALWLLSKRRAVSLVNADLAAGGAGAMYAVEYRHCSVCGRLLLGPEAHDYRVKQLRPTREWHFEQGPACSMECKPRVKGKAA